MRLSLLIIPLFIILCGQSAVQTDRSNIVVLIADDLGMNDVGYTQASDCYTPNIDQLADEGILFTHFYTYPLCTPTRAAYLTGRYSYRYGLDRGVVHNAQPIGLDLNETTVGDELHDPPIGKTAYRTYLAGKWHLGFCLDAYCPPSRGFDEFYGVWSGAINREEMLSRPEGKGQGSTWVGYDLHDGYAKVDPIPDPIFSDDAFTDKAIEWIQEHQNGGISESDPMFLTLSFTLPHEPVETQDAYDNIPEISGIAAAKRRDYCSMVANMDANIGLVLDELKADADVWDNTYLIFFSDNGGVQRRLTGSNYPFRSGKGSYWEGGIRTPLIFHGGKLPSARNGTLYEGLVHATDLMPTILGLAGQTPSNPVIDGFDLSNLFTTDFDDPDVIRDRIIIQVHNHASCDTTLERNGVHETICGAVIDGKWKLVVGDGVLNYDTFRQGGWVITPKQNVNVYPPSEKLFRCPNSVPKANEWAGELNKCPFVSTNVGCLYDLNLDPCETVDRRVNNTGKYNVLVNLLFDALDETTLSLTGASVDPDSNPANYADFYWRSWLNPGNSYSPTSPPTASPV